MKNDSEISRIIKERRKSLNFTQQFVAFEIAFLEGKKCSVEAYQKYEYGSRIPTGRRLLSIMHILGLKVEDFFP